MEVGGGERNDSRINCPVPSATPDKERSKIYRSEVPDFLLLNPSAYQQHNAKSLHETLGRKKKSVKYLDDLPTWGTCRWQQRFIKQATKQDVIKQFESMPS